MIASIDRRSSGCIASPGCTVHIYPRQWQPSSAVRVCRAFQDLFYLTYTSDVLYTLIKCTYFRLLSHCALTSKVILNLRNLHVYSYADINKLHQNTASNRRLTKNKMLMLSSTLKYSRYCSSKTALCSTEYHARKTPTYS